MKKQSIKHKKDAMLFMLIIVLLAQTLLYAKISESPSFLLEEIGQAGMSYDRLSDIFVQDTVRSEQRRILTAIRQSWVQYLSVHPEINLLTEDNKWNEEVVKEIFSIIGTPLRLFSTNSELVVCDLQTGDILVAPTLTKRNYDNISINGKPNLLAYHNLSYAYHPEQVSKLHKQILTKIDSDRNTSLTSLIYEHRDIPEDKLNDFNEYPLGEYNRQFIEKIILPYESIGVNGLENMQLVVILGVSERELMRPYQKEIETSCANIDAMEDTVIDLIIWLKLSIIATLFSIMACVIYTRVLGHLNEE